MITATNLSKRYKDTLAVNDLSFTVRPGVVTGFLGPNGAGKSTTMRMIMGLDRPSSGQVTIGGTSHRDLDWPLRQVGALLEARAIHPGRSAYNHLLSLAHSNAIPASRVDEVLDLVGLSAVATSRAGKFSLGMNQRLGIATALLGDPGVVLFDEPVNGLDPEGILWVRSLLQDLAKEGRTVFVSSHLMSEMALTATELVVIGQGRLIAASSVEDFISTNTVETFQVRSSDPARLIRELARLGATPTYDSPATILVTNTTAEQIGDLANQNHISIYELFSKRQSLEEVFMELTGSSVEYHGSSISPTNQPRTN